VLTNLIISVDDDISGSFTEPVTLQQVKDFALRQTDSYDDDYITALISEARSWIEKYTGLYIIPRSIEVVLLNQAGSIELPGPVTSDITLMDKDGEDIDADDYDIIGGSIIETTFCDRITASYEAGYTTVPEWVKNAIYAYIAHSYENKGDEGGGSPERCAAICRPYRRVKAWA
jgi:uncharacterized phiE125 gp8 family phage protein